MKRSVLPAILACLVILPATSVSAARLGSGAATVVQSAVGDGGLVLVAHRGNAEVVSATADRARFRFRSEERLETITETWGGFVVAGVRLTDEGSELALWTGDSTGVRRLAPPQRAQALQLRPVLLIDNGSLVGTAWLEGPDIRNLRVKTSEWDGVEWGPVRTVSRRSRGSQTGLTGTVLRDGSPLLVWSQHDGNDDELYFSWRKGSRWSRPARAVANNSEPDIAPNITFTQRGALLAWSRFDGSDYRLQTATFNDGEWRPDSRSGAPGSLYPELVHRGDDIYTIYKSAWPRGWSVRRSGPSGTTEAESFTPTAASERPILMDADASHVTVVWPALGRVTKSQMERIP